MDPLQQYDALRAAGRERTAAGDLAGALEVFAEALTVARAIGERQRTDHAYCNWAEPAIELGHADEPVRGLRQVLLASTDLENRYRASYHLARAYELRKEFKKALFYARAAREHASLLERPEWLGASLNQLGNLLLAESQLAPAREAYREALATMPQPDDLWSARVLDNLGYCAVVEGRYREGFELLYRSLKIIRRASSSWYEISTRLDLCFAHLEVGRLAPATRHGEIALRLSEEHGDQESTKNALYLLGEAASLGGDTEAARAHFSRLQRAFYPNEPFVTDFLLAVDVRKLVSLKA